MSGSSPGTGTGGRRRRAALPAGLSPLSPQRKWRAILVATLVLVPAFWSMLAGLVAAASDDPHAPNAAAALAFGLALIPFVFIVLTAFLVHRRSHESPDTDYDTEAALRRIEARLQALEGRLAER